MTLALVATLPAVARPDDPKPVEADRAPGVRRVDLPVGLVVCACVWWLVAAPRFWGGRGAGAVSVGAALTAVAVLAITPQRYLAARPIVLAAAVSVGAFGVALVSPTGWAGASTAATYVAVSWTVIAVAAAVARDPRVADVLLALVAVGVLVEVAEAWLPWWGGANAAAPIEGTFYWYDPFAAFMLAGSVIGLMFWLRRDSVYALLGLFSFTLGGIGLIYSTSRAAIACFAIGGVVVLGLHLLTARTRGLGRAAIALGVSAAATWLIAGPPFFTHRSTPLSGTTARSAGQSLAQNGGYRVDFWHEAIGVFSRHPLAGGGFHSLANEAAGHVPTGWPVSSLAHNGYLQALSDGGLLLGLPFLIAVAGICWWVVASLVDAARARHFSLLGVVVPLTVGMLLAHSFVDFDWSYAADFTVLAVLAGIVGGTRAGEPPSRTDRSTRILAGVVVAGVALTGLAAVASWSGDLRQSLPTAQPVTMGVPK